MIKIRAFKESDFETICDWWFQHGECPPLRGMMNEEGTLVLEEEGEPLMTLTVLMTQTKEISYFEGYCAKPGLPKGVSHELGKILWERGYALLKSQGYKRVIALTDKEKLADRYQDLGMKRTVSGIYALGRTL